jgi:hypothetical protein
MAAIPDASVTIRDGALGVVTPSDATSAALGTCSSGTINTLYAFTDPTDVSATLGSGPLVEYACHVLSIGGGVVYCIRVDNTSTPGTNGSVTHVGTGLSVLTPSGAPSDAYQVRVTIITGGTNPASGLVTFKYSVDGGDNYSPETALPTSGNYPITGTGLTLGFSAATLVAGDTYSFDCAAPGYNTTELTAAWSALVADERTWKFAGISGAASTASGQATVATAVAALLATAEAAYRFTFAIMHMPDGGDGTAGDSAAISAFASFASARVMMCAGTCELFSSVSGRTYERPASFPISARVHKKPISEDCSRVKSGPLPGISHLYRDEQVHRGLDAARFATLRTIIGKQGFWITNGRMMATAGSDYGYVQNREVMDAACTVGRAALIEFLGDDLRVNSASHPTAPGRIDERDARSVDSFVGGQVRAVVLAPGHCSDVSVLTNRTDNLLSTGLLRATVRVTPKAYARSLSLDIGFVNPALEELA